MNRYSIFGYVFLYGSGSLSVEVNGKKEYSNYFEYVN
jgi:hypothetical protein